MSGAILYERWQHHVLAWFRLSVGIILILCASTAQGLISTYADPRNLDEMESLRLTLRVDGSNQVGELDLTPLESEFEVLGSNRSSQYRSINGQTQSWVEYQITLRPTVTGTITIPPITINGDQSQSIDITVNPLDSSIKQAINEMVYFENELSSPSVYVQSELIFIRRLFYSTSGGVQMYSDLPGAPLIKDAVVVTLGQTDAYNELRNGLKYGVVEQRFAIIPEKSGELVIPKVAITSSIRLMKQGRVRRSGIRVNSEEVRVEVLPIPANYPADKPWLAATTVELAEVWEPDPPTFTVGEPLTRQVVARVTGNVASAIPPLTNEIGSSIANSKFKQYPQAPELRDDSAGQTNLGTRTEIYSILPSEAGSSQISPITLTWWDTETDQLRESKLAPREVRVADNPKLPSQIAANAEDAEPESIANTAADSQPTNGEQSDQALPSNNTVVVWAAGIFALGLLGFAWLNRNLLVARLRRQGSGSEQGLQQPKVIEPNPGLARRNLKQLSSTANPRSLRQQMINFVCQHDGLDATDGSAIARLQQDDQCKALLATLDQMLYGGESSTRAGSTPSAAQVRNALESYADAQQVQRNPKTAHRLPELYPAT